MNNLQLKLQVEGAVQQWIASLMNNNNIPASIMEDALNKVLLQIKDQVRYDLLILQEQEEPSEKEE